MKIPTPTEAYKGLSWLKKLRLRLCGDVFIGFYERSDEREPTQHYLLRCPRHGMQVVHPAGYLRMVRCPLCVRERIKGSVKEVA